MEMRVEEGGERMIQQSEDASKYFCRAGVMSRNEGEEGKTLFVRTVFL